jgi:hypothetical protein
MTSSTDVVPRLRGVGAGGDTVPVRVAGHVACRFAGEHGQDEPGTGPDIAHSDPGPALGGRPPQAGLDAAAAAGVQLA